MLTLTTYLAIYLGRKLCWLPHSVSSSDSFCSMFFIQHGNGCCNLLTFQVQLIRTYYYLDLICIQIGLSLAMLIFFLTTFQMQASVNEILTLSFQLAFSLRSLSLTRGGKIQSTTVSFTSNIIGVLKANIQYNLKLPRRQLFT